MPLACKASALPFELIPHGEWREARPTDRASLVFHFVRARRQRLPCACAVVLLHFPPDVKYFIISFRRQILWKCTEQERIGSCCLASSQKAKGLRPHDKSPEINLQRTRAVRTTFCIPCGCCIIPCLITSPLLAVSVELAEWRRGSVLGP